MKIIYQIADTTTGNVFTEGEWEFDAEKSTLDRIDITTDAGVTIVTHFDPPIMERPAGLRRAALAIGEILFKAAIESLEERDADGLHTHHSSDSDSGDSGRSRE